jgi:hypothetical protein
VHANDAGGVGGCVSGRSDDDQGVRARIPARGRPGPGRCAADGPDGGVAGSGSGFDLAIVPLREQWSDRCCPKMAASSFRNRLPPRSHFGWLRQWPVRAIRTRSVLDYPATRRSGLGRTGDRRHPACSRGVARSLSRRCRKFRLSRGKFFTFCARVATFCPISASRLGKRGRLGDAAAQARACRVRRDRSRPSLSRKGRNRCVSE